MNRELPSLLDARQLQEELGVKEATAHRIMRHCPRTRIGRKVLVARTDVRAYLDANTVNADGTRFA